MKVGIMQPYFLPYIGYFQLMSAVDVFVVYDNIQYTKKGWINRNRMLFNGKDEMFTIPLKKDSDYLDVCGRSLSEDWPQQRTKILRRISNAYRKAPYFDDVYPVMESVFNYEDGNLFKFILNSILSIKELLSIDCNLIVSSSIPIDHRLRSQDRIFAMCNNLKAQEYINLSGGIELYSEHDFLCRGIGLRFLKSNLTPYKQLGDNFVSGLSILDVLMFNNSEERLALLNDYRIFRAENK